MSDAGDVLHQSHCVAEHLFDDVHVFGRQRIGVMQCVEFGGIAEIALDKVASRLPKSKCHCSLPYHLFV